MRGAGCSMCCRCRASSTMSRFSSTWCAYVTCCSWQPPHLGTYGQGGVTRCGDASMTRTTSANDVEPLRYLTEISTSSPGMPPSTSIVAPRSSWARHSPPWTMRPRRTRLLLREPFAQQTIHQRHVGLATGRVLDGAHHLAEGLLLPGAEIGCCGGVPRDGCIDQRAELGGVADLGEAAIAHQRLGIPTGHIELGEQFLRGRAVDRPRVDQPEQARKSIDAEPAVLQRHPVLVCQGSHIATLPVRGKLGGKPGADESLIGVGVLARVGEHRRVVRGQPVLLPEAKRPRLRKLGQRRPHALNERGVQVQRREVRLGKVAVVVRLLLAPLRDGAPLRLDPAPRFLNKGASGVEHAALPLDLRLERVLHCAERVHVLDLDLDAKLLGTARTQRDVGVAAERSLLEVAVVDADVHQDLPQAHQVLARRLRRAQVRFTDNLHQRHTATIEVDQGRRGALEHVAGVMHRPGVLFEVDAGDPASDGLADDRKLEMSVDGQRQVVLRDLIALRQVRVEVVLPVELGEYGDVTVQRDRCAHRVLHRLLVDGRQDTGQSQAYRAGVLVRCCARVVGGARTEHLAAREQLRVHLEPDDHLVAIQPRRNRRRLGHAALDAYGEGTVWKSVACSYACATRRTRASSKRGAITCNPTGRPSTKPHGTEMPGTPARFAGRVTASHMYMESGSSRDPIGNATLGEVGHTIASTSLNTASNSWFTSVRTFCAWR